MNTPLDRVKALNYDHHRRMTAMHHANIKAGRANASADTDAESYRMLLRHVPPHRHAILELGSASGGQWDLLREWLVHDGPNGGVEGRICGLDLYEPMVQQAQAAGLHIMLGFVEDMVMYPPDTFDLVCSRHVMEHLGFLKTGMAEILRVTQPGGWVAHVTPNMPNDNEPAHLNHLDTAGWAAAWTAAGLTVLHAERHPFHNGEVHIVGQKQG